MIIPNIWKNKIPVPNHQPDDNHQQQKPRKNIKHHQTNTAFEKSLKPPNRQPVMSVFQPSQIPTGKLT